MSGSPNQLKLFSKIFVLLALIITSFVYLNSKRSISAENNFYQVYSDSLNTEWSNWSWSSEINFSDKVSFTPSPWGGLYLHSNIAFDTNRFKEFSFRAKIPNHVKYELIFYDENLQIIRNSLDINNYKKDSLVSDMSTYVFPLIDLKISDRNISGFVIQEVSGTQGIQVEFDDIIFVFKEEYSIDTTLSLEEWESWSWGGNVTRDLQGFSFSSTEPWGGLYLHNKNQFGAPLELAFFAKSTDSFTISFYDTQNNLIPHSAKSLKDFRVSEASDWASYSIPLSRIDGNIKMTGFVIQDASGATGNQISLRNITISEPQISPANTESTSSVTVSPSVSQAPVGLGYEAFGKKILKDGKEIRIKGVSWFGMETDTFSPHGLWTRNWKEMISQIKYLGFNSVRVPLCPAAIRGATPNSIDYDKNPDLRELNSIAILDRLMAEFERREIYVLLDHHRPDCEKISELWYENNYSEDQWIEDLVSLASRYSKNNYFLGIDIKNEPHGVATWGSGDIKTDWNKAAERAGEAILKTNPNILIFVQGVQENPVCSGDIGHWMGGNFEPINCFPIDNTKIPPNKLVLSPHVYGPDVYPQKYFNETNFPNNLISIWDAHFGSLIEKGYTVVPGEWGGKYGEDDPKDKLWQEALVNYFVDRGMCNSFYWSFNPNSSDTGGILKDDWVSAREDKITLLNNYFISCNTN